MNEAGFTVSICMNQPEVGRGAMTETQLQKVHKTLARLLVDRGAVVDRIFSCTSFRMCPQRKPAAVCYMQRSRTTVLVPAKHLLLETKPTT